MAAPLNPRTALDPAAPLLAEAREALRDAIRAETWPDRDVWLRIAREYLERAEACRPGKRG